MSCICADCVQDQYLKRLIEQTASEANPCEYCESLAGIELWDLAWLCDEVISRYYELTSNSKAVVVYDREPEGDNLHDTILKLTGIPTDAVEVVVDDLSFIWFDRNSGESRYGEDDPWFSRRSLADSLGHAWQEMEESLRSADSLFDAQALLGMIFNDLTNDRDSTGSEVIIEAGPAGSLKTLYRGRIFQTDDELAKALRHPEKSLGPPPAGKGSAGRMNRLGQQAFYGATDAGICVAEVRPPVGSRVALAEFEVTRPLRLLDMQRLSKIELATDASLFDPATTAAVERRDFLRTLTERLSAPIVPDLQDRDYLVTQAVADYLASHPGLCLDGIVYPSAQSRFPGAAPVGHNVVLFENACHVNDASGDKPTAEVTLWEYEEDGPGRYFRPEIHFVERNVGGQEDLTFRGSLRLRRESIVVREITAIRYDYNPTDVTAVASTDDWIFRG